MKILWMCSLTCNGNSHSLLNYPQIDNFLLNYEFLYHPLLPSKYNLKDIFTKDINLDILIIEGTIDNLIYKFDKKVIDVILSYAKKAKYILTVGTCATFGGIFMQKHNNRSGFLFKSDINNNEFQKFSEKTICISGCPIQPEVLVGTIDAIKSKYRLSLDEFNRPKIFFGYTVHNGCSRNEYFEYKIDNHNFGELEGCMFYEHGCHAPYTRGSCNKLLWNQVNSKTRNGEPCHGCTEADFPNFNLWKTKKHMGIPAKLPLGVSKRAYLTIAGVAKAFKIERFYEKIDS